MTNEINHELEPLDELVDTITGDRLRVDEVRDDGSVQMYDMTQGGTEEYNESEIVDSLVDGIFETPDGESHELVKSF